MIDLLRGVALIAMAIYHGLWDLSYFGFIDIGIGVSPLWIGIQRGILTAFLLLAGAGLTLSHGSGIVWPRFWRRFAILAAAALAMTVGTYLLFPDEYAYFGVLHLIALSSLLALPLVRAPLPLVLGIAVVVMVAAFFNTPVFDTRPLSWIGFFQVTPPTTDLVPLFPWFGVVLVGMIGMRLALRAPGFAAIAALDLRDPLSRVLRGIGRWSLLFYLLHQPVILGVIYPLSMLHQQQVQTSQLQFVRECTASCGALGREAAFCTAYCGCALDQQRDPELVAALAAISRTPEQQQSVDQMGVLCSEMAN